MSDEEEKRTLSSLKKNWKKTTIAIRTGKGKPPEDDRDVDKLVETLLKLKKAGKEPLILRLKQPVADVVASGRTREERLDESSNPDRNSAARPGRPRSHRSLYQ
jgi:hypothetical protein